MTSRTLTDLEERLAATGGRALRSQLETRLREIEARLVLRKAAMVPRAEFALLSVALDATRAAQAVIAKWIATP